MSLASYAAVALGGAVGATLRFVSVSLMVRVLPWPVWTATLMVNVLGGFLAGIVFVCLQNHVESALWRPLLMAGFLGGFTTFSAFTVEVVALIDSARYSEAALYTLLSIVLCVLASMVGMFLAKLF